MAAASRAGNMSQTLSPTFNALRSKTNPSAVNASTCARCTALCLAILGAIGIIGGALTLGFPIFSISQMGAIATTAVGILLLLSAFTYLASQKKPVPAPTPSIDNTPDAPSLNETDPRSMLATAAAGAAAKRGQLHHHRPSYGTWGKGMFPKQESLEGLQLISYKDHAASFGRSDSLGDALAPWLCFAQGNHRLIGFCNQALFNQENFETLGADTHAVSKSLAADCNAILLHTKQPMGHVITKTSHTYGLVVLQDTNIASRNLGDYEKSHHELLPVGSHHGDFLIFANFDVEKHITPADIKDMIQGELSRASKANKEPSTDNIMKSLFKLLPKDDTAFQLAVIRLS